MFNHTKEKANHPNILLYLLPGLVILGIVLLLLGRFSAKEAAMAPEGFSIEKLTFCHYQNPLGIDDAYPVFGWQMKSSKRGSMQSAYRITVSESADALKSGTYLWDSGKVLSGLSVGIPYEGPALSPQTRYYWQVSVWDENDTEAVSTAEAFFETGLLAGLNSQTENTLTGDAGSMPEDGADNSCMTVFGDAKWISAPGKDHVPGAILLHGWYDRAVGYPEIYNPWGDTNALLGKLEIKYTDGTVQVISTDQSFLCSTDTPVRNDDIYQGEFYDANKEFAGFDLPGFDASGWTAAAENQVDEAYLTLPAASKISEPIVCIRELTPLTVTTPAEKISVYNFGQNFAGTCRIRVKGEKGQILTLRYGEHLNTENLINKDDLPARYLRKTC